MLGIIRVLTTEEEPLLQEHSVLLQKRHSILSLSRCIPGQPYGIYSRETKEEAEPKINKLASEWAKTGEVDAIAISCAADPALAQCRASISIPVISAGEAGAHAACMISDRIGVLGLTQELPESIQRILGERLIGHFVPKGVQNTTDLFKETTAREAIEVVKTLVEQGASAILFACTGFSTIHLKETIQKEIAIPVIDLVEAQGMAYLNLYQGR